MIKTLRGKILTGIIIIILLLVTIIDIIVAKVLSNKLEDNIKSYMNMLAYIYINEFKNEVILNGGDKDDSTIKIFTRKYSVEIEPRDSYILFINQDIGKSVGNINSPLSKKALLKSKYNDDRHKVALNINFEDETIATYTYPTYINDEYYGTLFIQGNFNNEYGAMKNTIKSMVIGEIVSIIILIGFIYFLLKRIITPIQNLCSYMNKFSLGERVEDVEVISSIEVNYLYESFNNMKNEISTKMDMIKHEKKKVEELQASTKKFFDNVTHEMKTPIAAISGYAQLLIEEELDIETRKRALDRVMLENNRLNKLVTNILDISKGRNLISKDKEKFSLSNMVENVLLDFQVRLNKSGIIVDKHIQSVLFCGVKEEMKQVIVNLIDNSIKYNNGKDIIISLYEQEENIIFQIKNPCEYIDENIRENIFKPFVKYTYNRVNISSTGLGLYICKEIVEKNNGDISCEFYNGNISLTVKLIK